MASRHSGVSVRKNERAHSQETGANAGTLMSASTIAFATILASLNPSVAGRSQGLWELPAVVTIPIAARLRLNCTPGLTEKDVRGIQSPRPIKRGFCIESWHGHLASSF